MKLRARTSHAAAATTSPAPNPKKVKTGNERSSRRANSKKASDATNDDDSCAPEQMDFLSCFDAVADASRKEDFVALHKMIRKLAPNLEPTNEFSHGLIGYGKYDYKYKSGKQGTWAKITLANNKQNMALHCCGLLKDGRHVVEAMQDKLGKCSTGKSCVRFKRLSDLNREGLEELIVAMSTCEILQ